MQIERHDNAELSALERAAPKFLDAADALGKLTTFALDNPMEAVSLAIAAAVDYFRFGQRFVAAAIQTQTTT